MVVAVFIAFTEPFTLIFYGLYVYCGITDMVDGTIARKTHTESRTGEKLDSIADLIFVGVCLLIVLPAVEIPLWVWIWIGVIAAIKTVNLISGYVYGNKTVFLHTLANKVTGFLLFITPIALSFIRIEYISVVLCAVATLAAVQEGCLIRSNRIEIT